MKQRSLIKLNQQQIKTQNENKIPKLLLKLDLMKYHVLEVDLH